MNVLIFDSVENNLGCSEHEFRFIVNYAIRALRIPEGISIFFEIEPVDGYNGFVHQDECADHEYVVMISPTQDWEGLVKTVFHELAHVRQMSTGMLSEDVWHGVFVDRNDFEDESELPWEIEAYEIEEYLYQKFTSLGEEFA